MKRLILLRHGKSDWDADYDDDHGRPLNGRGVASAKLMGRVLASAGEEPNLIITSSALRARTTAELASAAGEWNCPVEATDDLYETSPSGALAVMADVDDGIERLLIVGHDPTWSELATLLTGGRVRMATATAAGIDFGGSSWGELEAGELAYLLAPRLFSWVSEV